MICRYLAFWVGLYCELSFSVVSRMEGCARSVAWHVDDVATNHSILCAWRNNCLYADVGEAIKNISDKKYLL